MTRSNRLSYSPKGLPIYTRLRWGSQANVTLTAFSGQTTEVINPHFVYLAMVLALVGTGNYLVQTWRGLTQPHRVTWGLWAVEGIMAFGVEVQQHVGISSLMTLVLGLVPLLVLLASFRSPGAGWSIDWIDGLCGAVSLIGLIFWAFVNEPTIALVSFCAADGIAAFPTLRKSWTHPTSETASAFIFGATNCGITLLTLPRFTSAGALFPGMILGTDTVLSILIVFGIGPKVTRRRARLAP